MVLSVQRHSNRVKTGLTCRASIVRGGIDKSKRTVTLALSSEQPVDRGHYVEILDHGEGSVDLSRLRNNHPFLVNHDQNQQVGVIEKAWISDRMCRATVRLGSSQRAE